MNSESLPRPEHLHAEDRRTWMSALADGEAQALDEGCAQWRDDPLARQDWHAWHLIGDVMRSEELATTPQRDAAFLQGLRARLAHEPVVLAPTPAPAARQATQSWLMPSLAAAVGVVVVAGALVASRSGDAPAPVTAAAPLAARDTMVVRDARLDEYLRVHQLSRNGVAAAAPTVELRRVELVEPAR
jgi:sigma-E factor negative regulatory protein RseA